MAVRTVEELKEKMRALMHQWHENVELPLAKKSKTKRKGNDGDAGNTLEALLGVPENNWRLPDFGEVEIKTQKIENTSLLTLFHKEPKPKASVPKLLQCLGWRHSEAGITYPDDEMSFRSTTYGHRYSDRGMKIESDGTRLFFLFDCNQVNREAVDRTGMFATYGNWLADVQQRKVIYRKSSLHHTTIFPIYYELADVYKGFTDKLNHTLLVFRKTKKDKSGKKYHWYEEAYLMKEVKTEMIVPLIKEGSLVIDFDARTRHNHGTKFRIKKDKASQLFTEFATME